MCHIKSTTLHLYLRHTTARSWYTTLIVSDSDDCVTMVGVLAEISRHIMIFHGIRLISTNTPPEHAFSLSYSSEHMLNPRINHHHDLLPMTVLHMLHHIRRTTHRCHDRYPRRSICLRALPPKTSATSQQDRYKMFDTMNDIITSASQEELEGFHINVITHAQFHQPNDTCKAVISFPKETETPNAQNATQ